MDIFYESNSLSDTVLYQSMNKNSSLISMISQCIKQSIPITKEHLFNQITQIERTRISPLSEYVLKYYYDGKIKIIQSEYGKVPHALPFIILKDNSGYVAYIFLNNFGSLVNNAKTGEDAYHNIQMKELYALMESAYINLQWIGYKQDRVSHTLGLMKICASIYTQMCMRIMNKEYTVSIDKTLSDQIAFCFSKFFIQNIYGCMSKEMANTYSWNSLLSPNKYDLGVIATSFDTADIETIEDLITFISKLHPRVDSLTFRYFTQCWINTYKAPALFGLEYAPYFISVIDMATVGSFMINQPMISDIKTNEHCSNTSWYSELHKLCY